MIFDWNHLELVNHVALYISQYAARHVLLLQAEVLKQLRRSAFVAPVTTSEAHLWWSKIWGGLLASRRASLKRSYRDSPINCCTLKLGGKHPRPSIHTIISSIDMLIAHKDLPSSFMAASRCINLSTLNSANFVKRSWTASTDIRTPCHMVWWVWNSFFASSSARAQVSNSFFWQRLHQDQREHIPAAGITIIGVAHKKDKTHLATKKTPPFSAGIFSYFRFPSLSLLYGAYHWLTKFVHCSFSGA